MNWTFTKYSEHVLLKGKTSTTTDRQTSKQLVTVPQEESRKSLKEKERGKIAHISQAFCFPIKSIQQQAMINKFTCV